MISFFLHSNLTRSLLSICGSLGIILQATVLTSFLYGYGKRKRKKTELILEILVFIYLLLLSLMLAQVQTFSALNLSFNGGFDIPRYLLFAGMAVLGWKAPYGKLSLASVFCTLPAFEYFFSEFFFFSYIGVFSFHMVRSGLLIWRNHKRMKNELSFFSIKEAVDQLEVGLMFTNLDGNVLLMNYRMEMLMYELCGMLYRDGLSFLKDLEEGRLIEGAESLKEEDVLVFRLRDGSVWRIEQEMILRAIDCIQVSASEITREWMYIENLKNDNLLLMERSERIKEALINIKSLSRQEEELRARARIHDVLGQKITILLQSLRAGREIDFETLSKLDDLITYAISEEEYDLKAELLVLKDAVNSMGVTLNVEGMFPQDKDIGRVFMDILGEAVTNAVRHGFAKAVQVYLEENLVYYKMSILNNGFDNESSREGTGLSNMRRKIERLGGSFWIERAPFCIYIRVPRPEGQGRLGG